MKRIDNLTKEQEARMAPFAQEWIARALSTEPADWARVESGIQRCYEFSGLRWHGNIVRVSSPLAVAFAGPAAALALALRKSEAFKAAILKAVEGKRGAKSAVGDAIGVAVRVAVGGAVRVAVEGAVEGAVGGAVGGAVRVAVGGAVGGAVGVAVGGAVGDAVGDAIGVAVEGAVGGAVRVAVGVAVGRGWGSALSNYWSYWRSWIAFFRDECGLELPILDRSRAYDDAQSAGWWWPHAEFTIVSDRPCVLERDDRGQLHCETGPAISWRDGWALHFVHGVRVTRQIVEFPETLTAQQISSERNAEVKRVMIERFGAGKYLTESGARVIDMDARTVIGGAPRCLLRTEDGMQWLVGTDGSTRRVYHMPVPREVMTCREAHCAIAGIDESRIVMES